MSLEEIFHEPGVAQIIGPAVEAAELDFTRDYCFDNEATLASLIEQGYILRPELNSQHPRYINERITRLAQGLENKVLIIPHTARIFPEKNPQSALKKLETVKLRRYNTMDEAIRHGITPAELMDAAFRGLPIDNTYVGYDWKGITTGNYKVARLVDCVRGALLEANSSQPEQVRLRSYGIANAGGKAHAVIEIPSVKKQDDSVYKVRLSNVPTFSESALHHASWFDLDSNHSCGKQTYAFAYGRGNRQGQEKLFCFHEIAAYHRLAKYLETAEDPTVKTQNPFAIPTEMTWKFYQNLDCVVKEVKIEGKIRRQPLNLTDREILLWNYVSLYGYRKTFGAQDYKQYMKA